MEIARITAKGQVTIPKKVREAAHLAAGDMVSLDLIGGGISMSKLAPEESVYLKALEASLSEWNSPEDEEAWRGL